jgi:hypothetical protein
MDITCNKCQGKMKIADEKLPEGKTAFIKCPRCQERISVTRPEKEAPDAEDSFDDLFDFAEDGDQGYDASEKPFDFIEEEGRTAMICESDALIREKLRPTLDLMEYPSPKCPTAARRSRRCATTPTT